MLFMESISDSRIQMTHTQETNFLENIANKLIHDEFIVVLDKPHGFPYCPPKLIGLIRYLRDIAPLISQNGLLEKLTDILNRKTMDPARKTMLIIAMDAVFSSIGRLSTDSGMAFNKSHNDNCLKLLTESLDEMIEQLEAGHRRLFVESEKQP
jgi:hypothetical protein